MLRIIGLPKKHIVFPKYCTIYYYGVRYILHKHIMFNIFYIKAKKNIDKILWAHITDYTAESESTI